MDRRFARTLCGCALALLSQAGAAWTQPENETAVATVELHGVAQVRAATEETWRPLPADRRLHLGDLLKTSEAGTRVLLSGKHRVWLNAGTVVQFRRDALALFAGELMIAARATTAGVVVRTPGTMTTSPGGTFSLALTGKTARVTVVAGTATVESGDGTCLLTEGQQTTAAANAAPGPSTTVDAHAVVAWALSGNRSAEEAPATGKSLPDQPTVAPPNGGRTAATTDARPDAKETAGVAVAPATPTTTAVKSPARATVAPGIPGVAFAAQPDAKGNTFSKDAASLTFLVTLDYGKEAPVELALKTALVDAAGKTLAQREDALADASHRYRVKRVVLDRLPAGAYVGRFTLTAPGQQSVVEAKFTVE